jgi:DNA-binding response OmpR family regulator
VRGPSRPVFCLIVEDDPLVGLDLADGLETQGYYVAGPFRSSWETARWLECFTPDVAVVDLALADGLCRDLILTLRERGISFVAHSGYPRRHNPVGALADGLWLEKPASPTTIDAALQNLLAAPRKCARIKLLAASQQQ